MERQDLTRAQAIREFCLECMNYQVREITDCTDSPCPLWIYRHGRGKDETSVLLRRQSLGLNRRGGKMPKQKQEQAV